MTPTAFSHITRARFLLLLCGASLAFLFCACDRARVDDGSRDSTVERTDRLRIVSSAPSITETLFELGLQDCLVAVSDYFKYPEEAKNLPKIGSLYEYNVEKIVELEPDFVVVLKENEILPTRLQRMGIETFAVDHTSLDGVLESFETLGERAERGVTRGGVERACPGALEKGRALRRATEEKIAALRARSKDMKKTRALISIYRAFGVGKIGEVYIAGANPYFNSALEILGAENVAAAARGAAPTTTAEGVIALNPEVIIDLSTDGVDYSPEERERVAAQRVDDWNSLGTSVDAVRNGRIYPIFDDYATVPGPRTILFLEKLAPLLHPDWNDGE